ncbi:MAG: hypothetical protein GQ537_08425 [Gammaproteobacteria bacterium]|nr:hypothetical protein [Gammaproteobacteria bacterium]
MLLAIRERIMGVVGWVILGILFVAFAFFGLNSYLQSNVTNSPAEVNGAEISRAQYQRAYQSLRNRMQNALGESYDPALLDERLLKSNALQQLINEELILQQADADGYAVSNQLVAAEISAVDAFKQDGVFSKERYEGTLKSQGISPSAFEWGLRRDILSRQFRSGIVSTAAAAPEALGQAFRLEGQQRRFKYLILPVSMFDDQVVVTDEDIEQYYAAHSDDFVTPERVKVQYLELDAAKIDTGMEIDEQALQSLYEEQSGKYVTEEQRHVRHILIQVPAGADETTDQAAFQKAESALQRLTAGESFEKLAEELSDDPASAANGGDLGFFGHDVMAPEFEEAAFALTAGEHSNVVKTPFGYHIIELVDIRPEVAIPLDEVRDELVDQLLAEERSDLFYEQSEVLSSIAFEQPDSLQPAADTLDIEIQESDWINRSGGNGIGEHAGVIETAYSEDVLLNGNNSAAVEIGDDHIVVLRIADHVEETSLPLEVVKGIVEQKVHAGKTRELTKQKGEEYLSSLQQGTTLESVAEAQGLEVGETALLVRHAQQPSRLVVQHVFTLPPPMSGLAGYSGLVVELGDYAIVALDEVKDGDIETLSEIDRIQAKQSLDRMLGATELTAIMANLEDQAVIIFPEDPEQP